MIRPICFGLAAISLGGCGPSIWTLDRNEQDVYAEKLDGARLGYALAKGEVSFAAAYTTKDGLSLTSDQQVKAQADFKHQYVLAYNHTGLSSDDITVQFEGAVLKKISSTTEDRSIAAVQAVNAILTQAAAAQTALNKGPHIASAAAPVCADMKTTRSVDVTHNLKNAPMVQQPAAGCSLRIEIKVHAPTSVMGVYGFANGPADQVTEAHCNLAVCFRLGGSFEIEAWAEVYQGTKGPPIVQTTPMHFTVLAPRADAIGFVRFDRRAFVANTTSVTFTNGIVSEFSAKNPSEVVGFLQLPAELLKGVTIAVPLFH